MAKLSRDQVISRLYKHLTDTEEALKKAEERGYKNTVTKTTASLHAYETAINLLLREDW